MAKIVQAVRRHGPKLERMGTIEIDSLVDYMARSTGLNRGEVLMVLAEISDAILFFNRRGESVKLPDIGTFSPGMDRQGNLRTNFMADVRLKRQMSDRGQYNGRILNKNRIGWTDEEYKALWDDENPDDQLEIGENR